MKKVIIYSVLLLLGLVASQAVPTLIPDLPEWYSDVVRILTTIGLSFIMIHVGYEFDIDKSNIKQYGWDYFVAATAAAFPWIFCCLYFIYVLLPQDAWSVWGVWKESLLASRFSAPTSAGVLFSMLAAAGLASTWLFKKARILAIFDDLDTVLLMIPLKMAMVGMKWQLGVIVLLMAIQLWIAWKFLHKWKISIRWHSVVLYSVLIVGVCEVIYQGSKVVDASVPVHIEVLLPAFVLGCIIARQRSGGQSSTDNASHKASHNSHHDDVLESPSEKRVSTIVSGAFMVLVGLSMPLFINQVGQAKAAPASMPALVETGAASAAMPTATVNTKATDTQAAALPATTSQQRPKLGHYLSDYTPSMTWGQIIFHVLVVTIICNIGKMFPALCYRNEARWRTRLALAIGMWPRGEVGAGVLVVSISYGIGGPIVVIAMLALALNLTLTGFFILAINKLLKADGISPEVPAR